MKKSQFIQFLLTLLFGPVGLFYSSMAAGFGFLIAAISFGIFFFGLGAIFWPIKMEIITEMEMKINMKIETKIEIGMKIEMGKKIKIKQN